jgi:His-Xaa-Ser system protein HxsD
MGGIKDFQNLEINSNTATFKLNPQIYPLDIIYAAAYMLLDRAFVLLDGDPQKEISVQIKAKGDATELAKLVEEFNEEMINYGMYKIQSEKNKDLREAILKRILITNELIDCVEEFKKISEKKECTDPENILKSWEQQKQKK